MRKDHRVNNIQFDKAIEHVRHTCLIVNYFFAAQTFEVENVDIVPLFDPPHLIKCIRNNLLTKDLAMTSINDIPTHIATWDTIKTAWIMDKRMNTIRPLLRKITKEHVIENKIKKMRVKHATQILSGTVASCIETLTRSKCKY